MRQKTGSPTRCRASIRIVTPRRAWLAVLTLSSCAFEQAEVDLWSDTDAPMTTITSAPPAETAERDATFEIAANEAATFSCRLDLTNCEACESPVLHEDLELGWHIFEALATDEAGNAEPTPASHRWRIVGGPETLLLYGPPPVTPLDTAIIEVTSPDAGATFECRRESNSSEEVCAAETRLDGLGAGPHRFEVWAVDVRGRRDPSPIVVEWTVDPTVAVAAGRIAVGHNHACLIDDAGALWCWGANGSRQLGLGDDETRSSPAQVGADEDWQALALGRFHSCGLRDGGRLFCWGSNALGQVGDGGPLGPSDPVEVAAGSTFIRVTCGDWHTCAIDAAQRLWCWGYGALGRLGLGAETDAALPVEVDAGTLYDALAAGASHTCGLRSVGDLTCWGTNEFGQLGSTSVDICFLGASSAPCALTPTIVDGGGSWRAVSAGSAHTCGLAPDDGLWCWGSGAYGQLGIGEASAPTPTAVVGTWTAVSAGGSHTCGVRNDADLLCWGDNSNGQLGRTTLEPSGLPLPTGLETAWSSVSAGSLAGCGIRDDGTAWCWGAAAYVDAGVPSPVIRP